MASLIDFYENIVSYQGKKLVFVLDGDMNIWFQGSILNNLLGYGKKSNMIGRYVDAREKKEYRDLLPYVIDPRKHDIPWHSLFVNESGFIKLALRSTVPSAKKFTDWISYEVIPTIRKTGSYSIMKEHEEKLQILNQKLETYKRENTMLKNNQKKEKYPEGGYIYIIKPSEIADDKEIYKIGKTDKKLNKRLNTHNTSVPNNVMLLYKAQVNCPSKVELCVKSLLYDYRYRNNKEYYECHIDIIIDAINECIKHTKDSTTKCPESDIDDNLSDETTDETDNHTDSSPNQIGGDHRDYDWLYLKYKHMYVSLLHEKYRRIYEGISI